MNKYLFALVLAVVLLFCYETINERQSKNLGGWMQDTRSSLFQGSVDWTPMNTEALHPMVQLVSEMVNPESVVIVQALSKECPKGMLLGKLQLDYWTGTSDVDAERFAKRFAAEHRADVLVELESSTTLETMIPTMMIRTTVVYYVVRKD